MYNNRYFTAGISAADGSAVSQSKPVSLYRAVSMLREAAANGMNTENAIIACMDCGRRRAVAYFSAWTETVRPVHSARDYERQTILEWEGPQTRKLEPTA